MGAPLWVQSEPGYRASCLSFLSFERHRQRIEAAAGPRLAPMPFGQANSFIIWIAQMLYEAHKITFR